MAQPEAAPAETGIDEKIKEIDASIEELRKKRLQLLEEKRSISGGTTTPSTPIPGTAPPRPPKPKRIVTPLEQTLNALEWRAFKKKDGEWTFLRERDGRLVEGLEAAKDFVDEVRKGKEVVVGKYRYKASEERFLNRFFAEQ